ncbi:hypothetical protein F4811DRAFT_114620 [Daldinia bambusicola]|nr:hypothetical protein F4811DRAFT_114620 [Daldinia bambusicola]
MWQTLNFFFFFDFPISFLIALFVPATIDKGGGWVVVDTSPVGATYGNLSLPILENTLSRLLSLPPSSPLNPLKKLSDSMEPSQGLARSVSGLGFKRHEAIKCCSMRETAPISLASKRIIRNPDHRLLMR